MVLNCRPFEFRCQLVLHAPYETARQPGQVHPNRGPVSVAGVQRTSYTMVMKMTVQAVYEDGVLRPLQPVPFHDRQELTVTISDMGNILPDHRLLVSPEEWASAASDDIGLDEVRRALSTIRGSLSEAIVDERRDR